MNVKHKEGMICVQTYHSPCGDLILGSFLEQLCLCCWKDSPKREEIEIRVKRYLKAKYVSCESDILKLAEKELDEYFTGKRTSFDVPLCLAGTNFQMEVWKDLLNVRYGQTSSYKQQAIRLNRIKSFRAVANADGVNALVIFIPCHRIIGSNHSLSGYSGGIGTKLYLLQLEQNNIRRE